VFYGVAPNHRTIAILVDLCARVGYFGGVRAAFRLAKAHKCSLDNVAQELLSCSLGPEGQSANSVVYSYLYYDSQAHQGELEQYFESMKVRFRYRVDEWSLEMRKLFLQRMERIYKIVNYEHWPPLIEAWREKVQAASKKEDNSYNNMTDIMSQYLQRKQ
jgi:hypothetical protein